MIAGDPTNPAAYADGDFRCCFISREIRRDAVRLWSTPLDAALLSERIASVSASFNIDGSFAAIASRAFLTAVFTVERTDVLRARRFCACRFRFSADLVLAKGTLPRGDRVVARPRFLLRVPSSVKPRIDPSCGKTRGLCAYNSAPARWILTALTHAAFRRTHGCRDRVPSHVHGDPQRSPQVLHRSCGQSVQALAAKWTKRSSAKDVPPRVSVGIAEGELGARGIPRKRGHVGVGPLG